MKRIGMVLDNPFTGDNRVINEARLLQQNGFEVFVLALNFGQHAPIEDFEGIRIRRIPVPEKLKNYYFAFIHWLPLWENFWRKHLNAFVDEYKIEVIHAHDLYMAAVCGKVARKHKLPLVLDLHENYPAAVKNYQWTQKFPGNIIARAGRWKKLEGKLLGFADSIIVLSEQYREQLCAEYPELSPKRFVVYPNVPDHEKLLEYPIGENPLPHPESHWLFYFGVIGERRGVYTAIDAVKILRDRGHDVRLLLAGNVNKAEQGTFSARINSPEVREFVLHKPWINISEFPTYANACAAGLSPIYKGEQHDIGVANKVFQYMLFGLPVVVSDSAAQAAVINENQCGVVFESQNAEDAAQVIEKLLGDKTGSKAMGANGVKAVMERYNLQIAGKYLTQLYKDIN